MNVLFLIVLLLVALWLVLFVFVLATKALVGFFELWYSVVSALTWWLKPESDARRTERLL